MSATTRTIQQPMTTGSIKNAIAMAAIVLAAAVSVSWGAVNLTGSTSVATPVQAPAVLDKGSRFELFAPQAGAAPGSILDRGGRGEQNAAGTGSNRNAGLRAQ